MDYKGSPHSIHLFIFTFSFQGNFKPEKFTFEVECDLPNAEIYKFTGFM